MYYTYKNLVWLHIRRENSGKHVCNEALEKEFSTTSMSILKGCLICPDVFQLQKTQFHGTARYILWKYLSKKSENGKSLEKLKIENTRLLRWRKKNPFVLSYVRSYFCGLLVVRKNILGRPICPHLFCVPWDVEIAAFAFCAGFFSCSGAWLVDATAEDVDWPERDRRNRLAIHFACSVASTY